MIDEDFVSALEIRFPSAEGKDAGPFPAELLYEDTKRDLAVLAVKTDLPPLRVAPAYKLKKGEDVTVIGNPGVGRDVVLENAITRGVMSTKTAIDGQPFYQMGIAINPGNSGGPVFDSKGQVIGVATLKSSKQEGLAFCIPVEDLNARAREGRKPDDCRTRCDAGTPPGIVGGSGARQRRSPLQHRDRSPPRPRRGANKPEIQQTSQKLDTAISELEKEQFPSYPAEVSALKSDKSLAPSVRDKVLQLSENFGKLKSTYAGSSKTKVTDDVLKRMKSRHRQLITDLCSTLKMPMPPAQMMTAFDDRKAAAHPAADHDHRDRSPAAHARSPRAPRASGAGPVQAFEAGAGSDGKGHGAAWPDGGPSTASTAAAGAGPGGRPIKPRAATTPSTTAARPAATLPNVFASERPTSPRSQRTKESKREGRKRGIAAEKPDQNQKPRRRMWEPGCEDRREEADRK